MARATRSLADHRLIVSQMAFVQSAGADVIDLSRALPTAPAGPVTYLEVYGSLLQAADGPVRSPALAGRGVRPGAARLLGRHGFRVRRRYRAGACRSVRKADGVKLSVLDAGRKRPVYACRRASGSIPGRLRGIWSSSAATRLGTANGCPCSVRSRRSRRRPWRPAAPDRATWPEDDAAQHLRRTAVRQPADLRRPSTGFGLAFRPGSQRLPAAVPRCWTGWRPPGT